MSPDSDRGGVTLCAREAWGLSTEKLTRSNKVFLIEKNKSLDMKRLNIIVITLFLALAISISFIKPVANRSHARVRPPSPRTIPSPTFFTFNQKFFSVTLNRTRANIQSSVEASSGCSGYTVIFSDTNRLIKTVVGDVDPDLQGNEVIAAGISGNANMIYKSKDVWMNEVIYNGSSTVIQLAVGDADPTLDGNEVIVMNPFRAILVWKSGNNWQHTRIHSTFFIPLWDVAVGEVDENISGSETYIVEGKKLIQIYKSYSTWSKNTIYKDPYTIYGIDIGDFDPLISGNEIVIITKSGNVIELYKSEGSWQYRNLYDDGNILYDVLIGDADSNLIGNEVLITGLSKRATLIKSDESFELIYSGKKEIKNNCVGDADSTIPKNEVYFVTGTDILELYKSGDNWIGETILSNIGYLSNLFIGDADPTITGNELYITNGNDLMMWVKQEESTDFRACSN